MRRHGLVASPHLARDPERGKVSHALVGHHAVRDWLVGELGFARRVEASQLAGVVGSHHGVTPEDGQLAFVRDRGDLMGTGPWAQARARLLERATARAGGREALAAYRGLRLSKPSQVLLTAIVIVADWIASNAELFPLQPIATADDPPAESDDERTAQRLDIGSGWGTGWGTGWRFPR
jgi:hypothetical protein